MGKEEDATFYNRAFSNPSTQYKKKPEKLIYYQMWKDSVDLIIQKGFETVIDLGCGPAHFAQVLNSTLAEHASGDKFKNYYGYDFSSAALALARKEVKSPSFTFEEGNVYDFDFVERIESEAETDKICVTAFEFLEHISRDLDVIAKIPKGVYVFFTVPDFNHPGHVRWFDSVSQVEERYGELIDIKFLKKMTKHHYLFHGIRS